ncbi:MAG TPA: lysylphosphatidylglycerol synthase domain-containing protein [Candidatus Saccharimonadales bacterium]
MDRLKRWLGPIFIILIVLFFVLYLKDIDVSVFATVQLDWGLLLLANIISLGFRYWGVYIWRIILRALGASSLPSFRILSAIYAKAWMARYIPGTVAWIGSKIYLANKHGISKSRLTVSSLVEAGAQVVATMSLALILLGIDPRLDVISWQLKLVMITIGVAATLCLYPPIFNLLLRSAYRLIRRKDAYDELRVNASAVIRSYLLYLGGALIAGSAYYFLAAALSDDVKPEMFWYIIGASSLAGALGMATPFVPSGIGVRDGVQLVLLSLILPKEIALIITIASRLWSAAVDVLFYLIAAGLKPSTSRKTKDKLH